MPDRRLTFEITGFDPDWAVHPGETLREVLELSGMTQAELARRCDLTAKHVNRVMQGAAPISVDVAIRLERVLHISAGFWARYQANYDVSMARRKPSEAP